MQEALKSRAPPRNRQGECLSLGSQMRDRVGFARRCTEIYDDSVRCLHHRQFVLNIGFCVREETQVRLKN